MEVDFCQRRYFKLAIRAFSSWLAIILVLQIPVIGGGTLSTSYIGTMIVFVYIWLPFMILPIQAALEKIPTSLLDASADLGAKNQQTFWLIIFPLTLPGIFTGSIFTFSLTCRRLHNSRNHWLIQIFHWASCLDASGNRWKNPFSGCISSCSNYYYYGYLFIRC